MARYILFISFLLFISRVSSQPWITTYGPDLGAKWVIEDYDKGFIVLGTSINNRYGRIIKTDINGNVLWNKKLGNGNYLLAVMNIELTADHGLVIGGTMSKYNNQQDAFILKLNTCGELVWCSDVYTPNIPDDMGFKVKPTLDKGYLLLGLFNSTNPNLRTNLFKFDSTGNMQWHQAYLPDSAAFGDDASDILVDSSGYLITATCYYPDPGQHGGWERFYLIKTDSEGNKQWSNIYGKNSYYHGFPGTSLTNHYGNYYSLGLHDIPGSSYTNPSIIKVLKNGASSYNHDIVDSVLGGEFLQEIG